MKQVRSLILTVMIFLPIYLLYQQAIAQIEVPINGKIAFASNQDGDFEIYVMEADGTQITQLTANQILDEYPKWSPDGKQIVFASDSGAGQYDIYTMKADGSDLRQITFGNSQDRFPAWSPDGTRIAFARRTGAINSDIYVMNSDGSNQTKIVNGQGTTYNTMPTWSADGNYLIFSSTQELPITNPFGSFLFYRVKTDGTELIPFGNPINIYGNPNWSWVNDAIVFYDLGTEGLVLRTMNADGSNTRALTQGARGDTDPVWSPDGSKVVFSSTLPSSANGDIFVVSADGNNVTNLTNSPDNDISPSWQPLFNEGSG